MRLGHILNIYLRKFKKKIEKIINKKKSESLGDRTTEIGGISNEEWITLWKRKLPAISHLTSHFHVKCSLLTVMITFIKKRLLNGTPPASTTFSHFRQDTKEEISHPKL